MLVDQAAKDIADLDRVETRDASNPIIVDLIRKVSADIRAA